MKNKQKYTFLDGSFEEQKKAIHEDLDSMTEEEHKRAMSDEFAYLDEDIDED